MKSNQSLLMPWGRYKGQLLDVVAQDKQYASFLRRFCPEIGCQLDAVAVVSTDTISGGCIIYTFPHPRVVRSKPDPSEAA